MARVGPAEISLARERIHGIARVTPVYGSETLSRLAGRPVHLKAENLQRTGSFKIRGAVNKLATLDDRQRAAGVVAASAGNHAQAVAWAAREAGIPATIFVPQDAPMAKVEATKSYGARRGDGRGGARGGDLRRAGVRRGDAVRRSSTPTRTRPSSPARGRSGSSSTSRFPRPRPCSSRSAEAGSRRGSGSPSRGKTRVIGVRAAPEAFSIADGIAVKKPGELTGPILDELLDEVVEVGSREIAEAMVLLLERTKLVVEGAGAVGIAALLEGKVGGSGPVAVVLSGGNIDASTLIAVMRAGLTFAGPPPRRQDLGPRPAG